MFDLILSFERKNIVSKLSCYCRNGNKTTKGHIICEHAFFTPKQYIINVSHFTRIHICKSLERIWQKKNLLTASFWDVHKTYYRKAKTSTTKTQRGTLNNFSASFMRLIRCSIMTRLLKTYFEYKSCFPLSTFCQKLKLCTT